MIQFPRAWLLVPAMMMADVAPDGPSCGCDSSKDVRELPGTVTITKIEDAPANENNCENDPVRVAFDFTDRYTGETSSAEKNPEQHLLVEGRNPARSFVERKGWEVGTTLDGSKLIVDGTVSFRFPGYDWSDYAMDCFKQ
jgi:hypothetical protein